MKDLNLIIIMMLVSMRNVVVWVLFLIAYPIALILFIPLWLADAIENIGNHKKSERGKPPRGRSPKNVPKKKTKKKRKPRKKRKPKSIDEAVPFSVDTGEVKF